MDKRIEKFIAYLNKQKLVKKYLYKHTWLSGSSTLVYPVSIWEKSRRIELQWASDKRIFNKFLKRVMTDNADFIVRAIFKKSDGSCPSSLIFYF